MQKARPARKAFADESQRRGVYLMAAALVPTRDLQQVSRAARECLPQGRRRAHFSDERKAARRQIIKAYSTLDVDVLVLTTPINGDEERARQRVLLQLLKDLRSFGVQSLVLDSRADRDQHDRRYIKQAIRNRQASQELQYEHRQPSDEPLLGLPDAFVWCYGAGNPWKSLMESRICKQTHL